MSNNAKKQFYIYLAVSAGCGLLSAVYEHFSHDVYSNYTVYLFAIPLLLGALPELIFARAPRLNVGGPWQKTVQAFAVATLAVGSLLRGILDIYGTTSSYNGFYFVAGFVLLGLSAVLWTAALLHHSGGTQSDATTSI